VPEAHRRGEREGGARGRRCNPLPGGFGHQSSGTNDRSARCSLDWDRLGRVTPAKTALVLPPEGGCNRITLRRVPGNMA